MLEPGDAANGAVAGQGGEDFVARLVILQIGVRELKEARGCCSLAGIEAGDGGEFVGVLDGQRVEDQGVDEGEDGGVGADPDGQGEDDDEDENRIAADAAQGVTEVFPDLARKLPADSCPALTGSFFGIRLFLSIPFWRG